MSKNPAAEVTIDGTVYVPKASTEAAARDGRPFRIVVADRGFVYVGAVEETDAGVLVHGARCIRRWGTKRGLGQLAIEGPTSSTVLDDVGTVRIPAHAVVSQIDVQGSASWS